MITGDLFKGYHRHLQYQNWYKGNPCVFDPTLQWSELCHLKSNSTTNLNLLKSYFGCNDWEAQYMIDLPLINIVPGSKKWNGTDVLTHKVGDYKDIKFINNRMIRAANNAMIEFINEINNEKILVYLEYLLEDLFLLQDLDELELQLHYYKDIVFKYRKFFKK